MEQKHRKEFKLDKLLLNILKWIFLSIIFIICITPVLWTLISSFKTSTEIWSDPLKLPASLFLDNFKKALSLKGLLSAFINSTTVSILASTLVILVTTMASYAMMYKFKLKNKLYMFLIIGIYLPINSFLLPYFKIIATMKLYDTKLGLIFVYMAMGFPLAFMIISNYMNSLPKELLESASIDGASYYRTFISIIFPLSTPGIATVATFTIINFWNEFLFATILTQSEKSRTLQVSIRFFQGAFQTDYGAMFAIIIITMIPTTIVYAFLQKRVIAGLTAGSVKG